MFGFFLRAAAQAGHVLEHGLLVAGVGADRLDELWHQVVALLQLDVDIGVAGANQVAGPDQAIEDHDAPDQHDERKQGGDEEQRGVGGPHAASLAQSPIRGRRPLRRGAVGSNRARVSWHS